MQAFHDMAAECSLADGASMAWPNNGFGFGSDYCFGGGAVPFMFGGGGGQQPAEPPPMMPAGADDAPTPPFGGTSDHPPARTGPGGRKRRRRGASPAPSASGSACGGEKKPRKAQKAPSATEEFKSTLSNFSGIVVKKAEDSTATRVTKQQFYVRAATQTRAAPCLGSGLLICGRLRAQDLMLYAMRCADTLDAQKREPTAQSGSEMRILGYRQLSIVLALPLAADGARASRWRACCAACAPPMPRARGPKRPCWWRSST